MMGRLNVLDPMAEFSRWYAEAVAAAVPQPDAMALATASADATPSVRFVLLKGWGEPGFTFFTDTRSLKGSDLAQNPKAALAIHWQQLHRQVRAAGVVSELDRAAVSAYWSTRPRESQAAAAASRQSHPIASRQSLVDAHRDLLERAGTGEIPLPEFWGGYLLSPQSVEFWQGEPNRLHQRTRYRKTGEGWRAELLGP